MTIEKIIKMAQSQIGVTEYPKNSNNVKYNTDFYGYAVNGSNYPWCAAFIWWVFKQCNASELFCGGAKSAYCPYIEDFYRKQNQWYSKGNIGDLVFFDFSKSNKSEHIGIVENVNSNGTYTTIEGNTGTDNNANGGAVMRRTRYQSEIRGFARPKYKIEDIVFTEEKVNLIGKVNATLLNIRKKPSTNSEIIGRHTVNDEVNIVAKTDNGWYRVDYSTIGTGYISSNYVTISEKNDITNINSITDGNPNTWAKNDISEAITLGILQGDGSGNYKLHTECTREDFIVMLYRLYNLLK